MIVFEKVKDHFEAQVELIAEVKTKDNKIIKRDFLSEKLISNDFDETISNKKFYENFYSTILDMGDYTINFIYEDKQIKRQRQLKPIEVKLDNFAHSSAYFLIQQTHFDESAQMIYCNFSGLIPFSQKLYDLIILSSKIEPNKEFIIKIFQSDSLVLEKKLLSQASGNPMFSKLNNQIVVNFDTTESNSRIIVPGINKNLFEGKVFLKIIQNDLLKDSFDLDVKWFDKPKSLEDDDFALEMVSLIDENNLNNFSKNSRLSSRALLREYWNKKDPTPETSFNELMEVFYQRVDYAEQNFNPLNSSSGAKSDRGKVFIANGIPDKIERGINSNGRVTETWHYKNPDRIFFFVDTRGDGNFKLETQ